MNTRRFGLGMLAVLGIALGNGCDRSAPDQIPQPGSRGNAPSTNSVARLHWLGKKRLSNDPKAASLMGIWRLPESAKLEAQMLDKLSLSPWRLFKGDAATNDAPITLLRPLLDDLVREESYFEIRNSSNQSGEIAFALRLSSDRATVWETNLAAVLGSLTGGRVTKTNSGWLLEKHDAPKLAEFVRVGEWIIVGLAQKSSTLLSDFTSRIRQDGTPLSTSNAQPLTDYWLALDVDPSRSAQALALDWQPLVGLSRISLSLNGDGTDVHTRGELGFFKPLGLDLEAWNIPTNLVRDPLISFTAVRGLKPLLASAKSWKEVGLSVPPNQFFFWSQQGIPLQTYFAVPSDPTSNEVSQVAARLLEPGNAWLATNGMGELRTIPNTNGIVWAGAPFMSPFLQSVSLPEGAFVYGGLIPNAGTDRQPPLEMLQQIWNRTNLVFYDWELTGPKVEALLFVGQAFRVVLQKPQLPFDSASTAWLKSSGSKLGNCGTVVTLASPTRLAFVRKSSIGLTALELHAFADWLESPVFPQGMHTLNAPPIPRIPRESKAQNTLQHR